MGDVRHAKIDCNLSGVNLVANAVKDTVIKVTAVTLVCAGAVTVQFEDGDGTILVPAMSFAANGGMDVERRRAGNFFCATGKGKSLVIRLGGAVQVSGSINYVEEG